MNSLLYRGPGYAHHDGVQNAPLTSPSHSSPPARLAGSGAARWFFPVLVQALGSFVVAGILPQLASGLHVSVGSAGQVGTVMDGEMIPALVRVA